MSRFYIKYYELEEIDKLEYPNIEGIQRSFTLKLSEDMLSLSRDYYNCGYFLMQEILINIYDLRYADRIFFSSIYFFRHALELHLKALIADNEEKNSDLIDNNRIEQSYKNPGHNLNELLKKYYKLVETPFDTENQKNWLEKYFDSVNSIDSSADEFRYPFKYSSLIMEEFIMPQYKEYKSYRLLDIEKTFNNLITAYKILSNEIQGIEQKISLNNNPVYLLEANEPFMGSHLWYNSHFFDEKKLEHLDLDEEIKAVIRNNKKIYSSDDEEYKKAKKMILFHDGIFTKLDGQKKAIELLDFESNSVNESKVFPVMYLLRMLLELSFKKILSLYYSYDENLNFIEGNLKSLKTHDLNRLFNFVKNIILEPFFKTNEIYTDVERIEKLLRYYHKLENHNPFQFKFIEPNYSHYSIKIPLIQLQKAVFACASYLEILSDELEEILEGGYTIES